MNDDERKKFGKRVDVKQIDIIIEMTKKDTYTRPEIAKAAGVSKMTVYNWQRKLGLIK